MTMHRLLAGLAVTAALAAVALALPSAAAAKPSACQRLKGRDLAPARYVKLVERRQGDYEADLVGCVLPRGQVRKIAANASGENGDGKTSFSSAYTIEQVIGRIVVVRVHAFDSYAGFITLQVHDLRSGGGYTIETKCIPTFYTGPCENDHPYAAAFHVTAAGRTAAILTGGLTTETVVRAFDTLGRGRTLDGGPDADIPAGSLRLVGNLVSWTNAGVARSASLKAG